MDGTFINCERNEDAATESVGAGGDVVLVRSNNLTGTITLTLQAESSTNDLLSAQLLLYEKFGQGIGSFTMKNLNGTTVVSSATTWIKKYANVEHAVEASGREWIFGCERLNMLVGGAII
jgi:hypothetical protein